MSCHILRFASSHDEVYLLVQIILFFKNNKENTWRLDNADILACVRFLSVFVGKASFRTSHIPSCKTWAELRM